MKIIYYSPHPTHDIVSDVGYATHQREVINALKQLGHTVIPVVLGGTEKSNLSQAGIPAAKNSFKTKIKKLIPKFIWTSLKDFKLIQHDKLAAKELKKAIVLHQPDLIYERSEYLQDKGVKVVKKFKVKYFIEINAPFVEEMKGFEGNSFLHALAHRKEKNKIKNADKIFVVSSPLKDFIIQKYQAEIDKIIVQPNCINLKNVKINETLVDHIRQQYQLFGKFVVGFVGSIFPHHGVDLLLDSFELSYNKIPNIRLMIVGDGSILNELKEKIEDKPYKEQVIFTGKVNHKDIYSYISVMNLCTLAKTAWYCSPIKIFEYAILQKPVIAPNLESIKDVMNNGVHGLLIDINKKELSDAIYRMFIDFDFAQSTAINFKNLVMENYTWRKAAKRIILECE